MGTETQSYMYMYSLIDQIRALSDCASTSGCDAFNMYLTHTNQINTHTL